MIKYDFSDTYFNFLCMCGQADGTYSHNIEKFVHKVCNLARENGNENNKSCLRASSLQCLSAMVHQFGLTFRAVELMYLISDMLRRMQFDSLGIVFW